MNGSEAVWVREIYWYDVRGLPVLIRQGYGKERSSVTFDAKNNVRFAYDVLGRKILHKEAGRGSTTWTYNPDNGKVASVTTEDGRVVHYQYDNWQRLRSVQDENLSEISGYHYESGRLARIEDESGVRRLSYDTASGNVETIVHDFDTGSGTRSFSTGFRYDEYGRLVEKSYGSVGLSLQYQYFNTGGLKNITLVDPDGKALGKKGSKSLLTYDSLHQSGKPGHAEYGNGVNVSWTYDASGLLRSMRAKLGETEFDSLAYEYRDDGLLSSVTDLLDSDYSEYFAYDAAYRLFRARGPYGGDKAAPRTVEYRYGALGPMTLNGESASVQSYDPKRPVLISSTSAVSHSHDARGALSRKTRDNFDLGFHRDARGRVRAVIVDDADGIDSEVRFLYTASGRRFHKQFRAADTTIHTYYIDPDYQIRKSGATELHTLTVRKPDGVLATFTFPHAWLGESQAAAAGHEAEGFVIFAALFAVFRGFSRRRLRAFGKLARDGRRFTALAMSMVLTAVFGCAAPELPLGPSGDEETFSTYVSDLVGAHFYVSNHLASNHLATDMSGRVVSRFVYLPYGSLNMALTDNDVDGDGREFNVVEKYTGQEYDYETGLYNYRARLYDPETARFLSADPQHKDLPGWNTFDTHGYVHGNPVNLVDPTGESALEAYNAFRALFDGGNAGAALWAASGVAGGALWAASSVAGGALWAASSVAGGAAWAASSSAGGAAWAAASVKGAMMQAGTAIGNGAQVLARDAMNTAKKIASFGRYEKHKGKNDLLLACEQALAEACTGSAVGRFLVRAMAVAGLVAGAAYLGAVAMPALMASAGLTSAAGTMAGIAGSVIIVSTTVLATAAAGYALGYLIGGLEKAQLAGLNWSEERAQQYGRGGAYAGAFVGLTATGSLAFEGYNWLAKIYNWGRVSLLEQALYGQVSNTEFIQGEFWSMFAEKGLMERMVGGWAWYLAWNNFQQSQ